MTLRPSGEAPTHDIYGNLLPGILCLHGGGSNSVVYKLQCRRIIWGLQSQFRFVFVQGPHESEPGYGMLPVFESCAPFYKWTNMGYKNSREVEVPPVEEVKEIDRVLRMAMEDNGGVDSFVGLMGFSQGSRLTAGLLLRQKMMEREGKECWTKFKFGIMIGGPWCPTSLVEREEDLVPERDYPLLKTVPTVHGWGADDPYKKGAVRLADACEGDLSSRHEFEGDHHLPLQDDDALVLCTYVKQAWDTIRQNKSALVMN